MAPEIPIIVVGAGLAGLTAAIDLGRSGVPAVIAAILKYGFDPLEPGPAEV